MMLRHQVTLPCDVPLPDPIPELKRTLATALVDVIAGWTPGELINRMHIDQPRVSDLRRGRLERISVERLVRWLHQMDRRVDVTVVDVSRDRYRRIAK